MKRFSVVSRHGQVLIGVVLFLGPSIALAQSCGPGQVIVDEAGHCCSPGQAWDSSAGMCTGTPVVTPPVVAAAATPTSPAPGNTWQIALGISLDTGLGDGDFTMGQGGNLALGEWFQQRFYVGGLVHLGQQASMLLARDMALDGRLGLEGRFAFADGTASERINHGDWQTVGTRYWLGAVASYETTNFGATNGASGMLELGMDVLGQIPVGFVLSAAAGPQWTAASATPIWSSQYAFNWIFHFDV